MKTQFATLTLAVLGGLSAMAMPATSQAGVVGEYINPSCGGTENLSVPVTATGHTWVAVGALNTASLQGLNALVLRSCGGYANTPDVNAAVNAGMALVLDTTSVSATDLPGPPALAITGNGFCNSNYKLAIASPIATGPGGILTDSSLDVGSPTSYCTFMGSTPVATLPTGVVPFYTTTNGNDAVAFGYKTGAGRVAVSITQFSHSDVYTPSQSNYAGIKTYFINALNWALSGSSSITCASEGYTGTQLLWCQKICESGLTGKELDVWLQRWIRQFRKLPYCALPT
ncbi:MAG: hypothetical protein KGL91_11640 [Xanthomonadaceae bacterium]|nr:hypothetical protein [Xanthomonadaceae bacterium]